MVYDDVSKDGENTESLLSDIQLNHELLLCDNAKSTDPAHTKAIDLMYNDIVKALQTAGDFLREQVGLRAKFK